MKDICYKVNPELNVDEFISVLKRSTLGERRPIDDYSCMQGMLDNANLTIGAYSGNELIGIARSVTDFHYACYLSDLAVDKIYQGQGIGKILQQKTQEELGPHCKLILLAAPAANTYYEHLGFERNERCWVLERDKKIRE